ncbi:DegQ family serine endoprotease [Thiomicrorhabdus sediminis]|uniref:Probable periplasmic serine endoprotease DegP-like n=1 Tax=Thiomicrorhabdus sediminis TaxID=2580412 RepID=A0A4P9K6P1_9GAMM|nr:DegQ family serine endoprotease [Thiomicrorhabdus sediminis]QCU89996.1 DegQ family serine endoprotease [Thiomicrorhabdus sediminis]
MKKAVLITSLLLSAWLLYPLNAYAAQPNKYGLPDFSALVEQTNPIVVNISTTKNIDAQQQIPPQFRGMPEEMLRYFFGIPQPRSGEGETKQQHSLGSGFIISEDGYILTNNHVVEGADEVIVRLRNRKEMVAQVVGSDKRTDVALLKIDGEDLPYAKIGSSADLKVGQWVLAIGEPFGLDFTATHGIISALGRALPDDTYVPFIQSDVPINPGNSGGPLFNLDGEVVGINSQIYSKSGGSMGLSFSIPIDIAMTVANQIKADGKVTRGYLGVQIQEVTSDLAQSFGLDKPYGALVGETYPDTAAQEAGIEAGDIILEFNGQKVEKSTDLPPMVGVAPIDKPIALKILRQGKTKRIKVRLKSLDEANQVASSGGSDSGSAGNRLGAYVQTLDKEALQALDLPFGVAITKVFGGPAKKAGLRQGDVIVSIDFKPVKDVASLKKLLKKLPEGRSLPLRIIRNKRSMFIPITLED